MANNEINDLTAKTTPVSTDEVEIQETAGGLSKKATVGNLAKGMSYNDLNDKPSIPTVSDTAYDATSWNGNTDAPTKNAVRDKIESMGSGDVVGPASATTGNIPSYNGTTGKLLSDSGINASTLSSQISDLYASKADSSALTSHTGNTSNPHSVTASQVGLGNVDNTSDANKPISTATQTALDAKRNRPNLVDGIDYPHYSAHRGGLGVYPEASLEAYEQVARSSFSLECDVRALSDGTLVLLHDATVDRTMTGETGNASSLTLEEWRACHINPVITDGREGTPLLFTELLDRFGGQNLIVAELKDYGSVTPFIDAIKDRSLQDAVIAACFDWTTAQALAAAGLRTMFCINTSTSVTASDMTTAGVEFLCASQSTTSGTLSPYTAAGIKTFAYTVNTSGDATTAFGKGFDAIVSDDPWTVSQRLPVADTSDQDGVWRDWTPDFTQGDAMSVSSVSVKHARYMIVGNTAYFKLNATFTVGGTVDSYLQLKGMPVMPVTVGEYILIGSGFAFWPALVPVLVHVPTGTPDFVNIHQTPATNWSAGTGRQVVISFSYEF